MLSVPTLFPNPGSWALIVKEGRTLAVRIMSRERDDGLVEISDPTNPGSTGYTQAPLADLLDPTPLTAAETAEMEALEIELQGRSPRRTAKHLRAEALRARMVNATELERLLRRIPARQSAAAAAAARTMEKAA
jgi:hypothetical protein